MRFFLNGMATKEDIILYIKERVRNFSLKKYRMEFEILKSDLNRKRRAISREVSFEEMYKILINEFIDFIENNEIPDNQKKEIVEDYFLLWINYTDNKNLIKMADSIFSNLSFHTKLNVVKFVSEDKKIEFLEEYHDYIDIWERTEIIKTIKDEEKKLEEINKGDYTIYHKMRIFSNSNNQKVIKKLLKEALDSIRDNNKFRNYEDNYIITADFVRLLEKIEDIDDVKEIFNEYIENESVKECIEFNPEYFIDEFLGAIEDDKLVIELIGEMKKQGIEFSTSDIIASIKSIEGIEEFIKRFDVKEGQKIALGCAIDNKRERKEWLDKNTNIKKIAKKLPKKQFDSEPLNLPKKLTIGLEFETEGVYYKRARELLKRFKLKDTIYKNWKVVGDGSLTNGTEIISPILDSSAESMKQVDFFCKFMQETGMNAENTCGGHIHLGADYLEDNLSSLENLLEIWTETEELFYKMSNDVGELPRKSINTYASNQTQNIEEIFSDGSVNIDSDSKYEDLVRELEFTGKFSAISFENLNYESQKTIEFRLSNGTTDARVEKENIFLYGRLLVVCKKINKDKELYKKFQKLKDHNVTEAEKVERLLDLLFDNENEKQIYRNRWKSVKDNEIFDKICYDAGTFIREEKDSNDIDR